MQEINPSVKKNLIDTSNYLNDVATIYNKCIEETKNNIVTTEGIRISDLVKEPAPEAILFEILHPLGFNSAQIKDIAFSLHSQPGKQFCSKKWRVIKEQRILINRSYWIGKWNSSSFSNHQRRKRIHPWFPNSTRQRNSLFWCRQTEWRYSLPEMADRRHFLSWLSEWKERKNKRLSDRPQIFYQSKKNASGYSAVENTLRGW